MDMQHTVSEVILRSKRLVDQNIYSQTIKYVQLKKLKRRQTLSAHLHKEFAYTNQ